MPSLFSVDDTEEEEGGYRYLHLGGSRLRCYLQVLIGLYRNLGGVLQRRRRCSDGANREWTTGVQTGARPRFARPAPLHPKEKKFSEEVIADVPHTRLVGMIMLGIGVKFTSAKLLALQGRMRAVSV